MATPATTGQLRTRVQDMQIGDYIKCHYNANNTTKTAAGHFYAFAQDTAATEIPLDGLSTVTTMGFFYLIKVDYGLLIADRVVRNSIAWDALNTAKYIEGRPQERDGSGHDFGFDCTVRSLTGGVAYADANGNMSLTDQGIGAWPTNNEWDRYIVNFPMNKIQSGKTLEDVFHCLAVATSTKDTPVIGISTASSRVRRGLLTEKTFQNATSSFTNVNTGFRPVFEYKEV